MLSGATIPARLRSLSPAAWAGMVLLLGTALLYLATLDNGIATYELHSDLVNHQRAQVGIRLANQPGYPLYTMLGLLWARVGRLLLGWAMNPIEIFSLHSTFWALGALAIFYLLILELTDRNWIIAFLVTLLYASSFSFWYHAVTTEKDSAAIAQAVAAIWAALRWERTRDQRWLLILALLTGLALAHAVTGVFITLSFLLVLYRGGRSRPALLWRPALVSILPLLSYAYVLAQGHLHPEWRGQGQQGVPTLGWFTHYLSNPDARELLAPGLSLEWPAELIARTLNELTPAGLLLGLVGFAVLGRRGSFLGFSFGFYLVFAYLNRYGSWVEILMPAFALLSIGIVGAAHRVWRFRSIWSTAAVILGVALLAGYQMVRNYPLADQRDKSGDGGLDLARAILSDDPPLGSRIIVSFDEALSLEYLTRVWGERGDILFEPPQNFSWEQPRPFYVTINAAWVVLNDVPKGAHLSSAGSTLIEVRPEASPRLPRSATPMYYEFEGGLRLVGYRILSDPESLRANLYWQAGGELGRDFSISLRPTRGDELVFVDGQLLLQDHAHPVWGFYPTSRWERGEVVRDDYLITLPDGIVPDGLRILVYYPIPNGFHEVGSFDLIL